MLGLGLGFRFRVWVIGLAPMSVFLSVPYDGLLMCF